MAAPGATAAPRFCDGSGRDPVTTTSREATPAPSLTKVPCCAWSSTATRMVSRCAATVRSSLPSVKEQIADHLANRRVRPLTVCSSASQARSAYAAYASTPTGRVMDVSRCSDGQMPGSGETRPNPVFCAMPTQPDHTSAAAGAARTSSGQDRTALVPEETAADRSPPAGLVVRAAGRPPGPRSAVAPGRFMPAVSAAMEVTTCPGWREGGVPRSARPWS